MVFHILRDGLDQFLDAGERAAPDAFVGDLAKPALDQVEPRTGRWRKMQMKSGMALEPGFDPRVLVCGVVVDDQMQFQLGGRLGVDLLEKADELLMAVARHAIADDFAVKAANSVVVPWRV